VSIFEKIAVKVRIFTWQCVAGCSHQGAATPMAGPGAMRETS